MKARRSLFRRGCQHLHRRILSWQSPESRALRSLKRSISHMPRHQPGRVRVWGWDLEYVDAASCVSAFDFIVVRKWYDFQAGCPNPRIIDCGSNIGVSVLYHKRLYPAAEIIAFEPDPQICSVLRRNIRANNVSDVHVVEAALWDAEGELSFCPDRADGGRLALACGDRGTRQVKTERLAEYLRQPVDLLKMDIEGAEGQVISDCAASLHNVRNVVMEYHTIAGKSQDLRAVLDVFTETGFRYYVNSFGDWISLTAPPPADELGIEQCLMISATRFDGNA